MPMARAIKGTGWLSAERKIPCQPRKRARPSHQKERCRGSKRCDRDRLGPIETEQSTMYTGQKNEGDNDVSSDDHKGKKPKPRPEERISVHTLVCMHLFFVKDQIEERVSVPVSVKSESSTSIGIFVRLAITRITGKPVGRASGVRGKRPARWQPSVDLGCESRTLVLRRARSSGYTG